MNWHWYSLFFDPRCILFHTIVMYCLLPSDCLTNEEKSVVLFFIFLPLFFSLSAPLPSRVFLWRKNMTEIVLMIPQMSPFVCNITNSSLNVFTVVACALWDIQRTECRMKVKKEPQDIILSPFLRWKWKIIIHSLFLSTSIYKQGRLGKLVTVCEVLLHIIKIMN